jgi:hypothetical protein
VKASLLFESQAIARHYPHPDNRSHLGPTTPLVAANAGIAGAIRRPKRRGFFDFVCKKQKAVLYVFYSQDRSAASSEPRRRNERFEATETFCTQPETRVDFFLFFSPQPIEKSRFGRIRPSKSKLFAWFYLDLLGRNSRSG